MITDFKAGDLVPEWVLRAPLRELQQEATFGVDVAVIHANTMSGPVTVRPIEKLDTDDCLVRITERGAKDGWQGAPTEWNVTPIGRSGMSDLNTLLCCPFCGGDADIRKEDRGEDCLDSVWVIGCESCPAEMVGDRLEGERSPLFNDERALTIAAWNRRAM